MIQFSHPARFILLLPWGLVMITMMRSQLSAQAWLETHVDKRFLATFTRSTSAELRRHVAFLAMMGVLLITSASGPWIPGTVEVSTTDSAVILVIDSSLSMGANDAGAHPRTGEPLLSRFDQARSMCLDLIELAPETAFGLISFSGSAVIHSPPTHDIQSLKTLLKTMRYHYYSQSMGSRFSSAFDAVIHLKGNGERSCQVVLLSDGELPEPDDYSDALNVLSRAGTPVHTVAVGSRIRQKMSVYVLEDVLAGLEEKRIAAEYQTRRDDRTLREVSKATAGTALVVEDGDWAEHLFQAIMAPPGRRQQHADDMRKDLSPYPMALFLICLVIEWTILSPRPVTPDRRRLPWRRRGASAILVIILGTSASTGCRGRLLRAHHNNEKGIEAQHGEEFEGSLRHFERSAAFHIREFIPTYNRGNSLLGLDDVSSAHEAYQRAILLQPHSAESFFNDGHALYRWGELAIDPEGCNLDRTRELWQQAIGRFASTADLRNPRSKIGRAARENLKAIEERLSELDTLAERCPDSPNNPQNDEENKDPSPQEGSNEQDQPDGSEEAAGLTPEEREQIAEELQRIKAQAENTSTFRQTPEMQLDPDSVSSSAGREILW